MSEQKPQYKFCPLKPWITATGEMTSELFWRCMKEDCALWDKGQCAKLTDTQSLRSIDESLKELVRLLNRGGGEH